MSEINIYCFNDECLLHSKLFSNYCMLEYTRKTFKCKKSIIKRDIIYKCINSDCYFYNDCGCDIASIKYKKRCNQYKFNNIKLIYEKS